MRRAEALARDKTGNKSAAKMAMMAMTTRSSISVKAGGAARRGLRGVGTPSCQRDAEVRISIIWPASGLGEYNRPGRQGQTSAPPQPEDGRNQLAFWGFLVV